MGTSMESIQNAYSAFAKQNYTLLDNLKLGYGGTKTEMERLLADAEKFSGVKYDISNLADVYTAIHVIQQEMGIAGTTAEEAMGTITGSAGQVAAAWQNLVAGFADPSADLSKLIDDVVTTAETSFKNLLPTVENAISGIADFIGEIAPLIAEKLPDLAEEVIPSLLETANTVVNTLADNLPAIAKSVLDVVPKIITDVTGTVIDLLPDIAQLGVDLIMSLAHGITESAPKLIDSAMSAINEIGKTLTDPETLQNLFYAGLDMVVAIGEGIGQNIPKLADTAVDIVLNLVDFLTDVENIEKLFGAAVDIVLALGEGLITAAPKIVAAAGNIAIKIIDAIFTTDWIKVGQDLLAQVIDGLRSKQDDIDMTPVQRSIKKLSEGYFSYYDEALGEADNKLRQFTDKYAAVIEDYGDGFKLNFDGTEDAEYVIQVLTDLQTAIEDTGETSGALSNVYAGVRVALTDLKASVSEAIQAEHELALQTKQFIPTEAIRQMAGKAAEPLHELGADIDALKDNLNSIGSVAEDAVGEAEKIVYKSFAEKAIGDYTNLGVKDVLGHVLTDAEAVSNQIASEVYSASNEFITRLVDREDLTIEEQIAWWQKIQNQFIKGSKQFNDAEDKIFKLQKQRDSDIEKENKKVADEAKKALKERTAALKKYEADSQKIYDSIAQVQKKYADTVTSRTNEIYNQYSLFAEVPERILVSGEDLAENLKNQIDSMKKFYGDIDKLQERGVSAALVSELESMGVGALDQIDALLDLSDEKLNEYDKLFTEKHDFAGAISEKQLAGLKEETDKKIEALYQDLDSLTKENAEVIGKSFADGISEGIKSGIGTIKGAAIMALSAASDIFGFTNTTATTKSVSADTTGSDKETTALKTASKASQIVVNINGIQYQDMSDLTKAVAEELQFMLNREAAGYA